MFPKSTPVHGPTGILWPGISSLEQEDNVGCRAEEGVWLTVGSCFSVTVRALAFQPRQVCMWESQALSWPLLTLSLSHCWEISTTIPKSRCLYAHELTRVCVRNCVLSDVRSHTGPQIQRNSINFAKSVWPKALPVQWESQPCPAVTQEHWSKAHTLGTARRRPPERSRCCMWSEAPHLVFSASAAHSCLQSSCWEGSGASHLLLEVASAAPLLLWLHPHSTAILNSCSLGHL